METVLTLRLPIRSGRVKAPSPFGAKPDYRLRREHFFKRTMHPDAAFFFDGIDARGVADDRTLRAVEAVVPVILEGTVNWINAVDPDYDWVRLLDMACGATLAFGKLKADGYGRAIAAVAAPE